jgi:hypothetical protein
MAPEVVKKTAGVRSRIKQKGKLWLPGTGEG